MDTIKSHSTVTMTRTYDQSIVELNDNKNGTFSTIVGIMKNFDVKVTAEGYDGEQFALSTKFDQLVNFDTITVTKNVYLKRDYAPVVLNGQLFDKVTNTAIDG